VRVARFKVAGSFDSAGAAQFATVEVGRDDRALFSVRPYRRRRVYELPLAVVAEIVAHRVQLREAVERRAAKKARRAAR
jgi:hypothetical protein